MGQELGRDLAQGFFCSLWLQLGSFTHRLRRLHHVSGTLVCYHMASPQHDSFWVVRFLTWFLASKGEKRGSLGLRNLRTSLSLYLLVKASHKPSQDSGSLEKSPISWWVEWHREGKGGWLLSLEDSMCESQLPLYLIFNFIYILLWWNFFTLYFNL